MPNPKFKPVLAILAALMVAPLAAATDALVNIDGSRESIQPYVGNGKWVVAKIWAHDCHVCNEEAPKYAAFHKKHKDSDIVMLGISLDGRERSKEALQYIKRHRIPYTNLIGEPRAITGLYERMTGRRWIGTPTFMIFHPSGKLVAEQAGNAPPELIEDFIANYPRQDVSGVYREH